MNKQQHERHHVGQTTKHRVAEMLLFLITSAAGIYSLGQALAGLFEPGKGFSLPWLTVAGVTLVILSAQMGRVQDTWPHEPSKEP